MSFWQSKTKILRPDLLFSQFIRKRANWHCELKFKCNGVEDFRDNKGGLTCSHFEKRSKRTVRYDPENCDAACRPCHRYVEDTQEGIQAYKDWKKKKLGDVGYRNLIIRANQTQPPMDKKMELLYVKELIKQLTTK